MMMNGGDGLGQAVDGRCRFGVVGVQKLQGWLRRWCCTGLVGTDDDQGGDEDAKDGDDVRMMLGSRRKGRGFFLGFLIKREKREE